MPQSYRPTRRGLLGGGLSLTALVASGAIPGAAFGQSAEPIKVGWFAALSGPYATGALSQDAGTHAAVQEINDGAGVLGRKLELITRDTTGDPGKAVNFAQELLFSEKVNVLLGPNSSGEALPIRDFIDEADTVNFPTALIDSVIDPEKYPTIFRLGGSTGQQIAAGIKFTTETLGRKQIALFVDNLSYGVLSRDLALAQLGKLGITPTYVGNVDHNKVDMGDDIGKARDAGADVMLVWTASSGFMARILTARGEQKWGVPAVGAPIALTEQVTQLVKPEYLDGDVLAVGFRHLILDKDGRFPPLAQKVLDDHRAIVGPQIKNGVTWILLGYSTVMLWAKAVEMAGGPDTAGVVAAIESMRDVDTAFGRMTFGPGRHDGLQSDEYALLRVNSQRNGGYQAV